MPFKSPLMGSACFVTNKRAWSIVLKYVCLFWWFFLWTNKNSLRRAFRQWFQNYLRIRPSFFCYRDIPWMLSSPQHSTPPCRKHGQCLNHSVWMDSLEANSCMDFEWIVWNMRSLEANSWEAISPCVSHTICTLLTRGKIGLKYCSHLKCLQD